MSEPTPEPVIPVNTNQSGKIFFYYAADTKAAFDAIKEFPRATEFTYPELKPKIQRSHRKALQGLDIFRKLASSFGQFIETLGKLIQLQEQCAEISFGNPVEYEGIEDIDDCSSELVRARINNAPATIYRSLYLIEWSLEINLPEGWKNLDADINTITSNAGKRALYARYMYSYFEFIRGNIKFRKKYYTMMERPVIHNDITIIEFLQDLHALLDNHMEYQQRYIDFIKAMSKKKLSELDRRVDKQPGSSGWVRCACSDKPLSSYKGT